VVISCSFEVVDGDAINALFNHEAKLNPQEKRTND
jgi:hypothetical protein